MKILLIMILLLSCSGVPICGIDPQRSESRVIDGLQTPVYITADMYSGDTLRIPSGALIGLGRGVWYSAEQLDIQFIVNTPNHVLLGDSAGWFVGWRIKLK